MIRRTLGAPLGGTTAGGQYGFDCAASRPISPPNFDGGGGRYLPSIVVVALGEPGVPVICWARAVVAIAKSEHAVSRPADDRSLCFGRKLTGWFIMVRFPCV